MLRDKENSTMSMAMSMRDSGSTTNRTATVFMSIRRVQGMKANGKMINSTERESKSGTKVPHMKECMLEAKKRATESTYGRMGLNMKVTG